MKTQLKTKIVYSGIHIELDEKEFNELFNTYKCVCTTDVANSNQRSARNKELAIQFISFLDSVFGKSGLIKDTETCKKDESVYEVRIVCTSMMQTSQALCLLGEIKFPLCEKLYLKSIKEDWHKGAPFKPGERRLHLIGHFTKKEIALLKETLPIPLEIYEEGTRKKQETL